MVRNHFILKCMKVRCYVSRVIIQSNLPDKMKPKTKKCFFISEGTLYDGQIKHILRASISSSLKTIIIVKNMLTK